MKTRAGMKKLLGRIMESGGMTDDMQADAKLIMDDFDEREGMLRRFGEVYDGEDQDDFEYKPHDEAAETPEDEAKESPEVQAAEAAAGDEWHSKYDDLYKKYIDRFFGGRPETPDEAEARRQAEKIKADAEDDVKRDEKEQTIDDLLTKIEG